MKHNLINDAINSNPSHSKNEKDFFWYLWPTGQDIARLVIMGSANHANGVYLTHLETGAFRSTRKITLLK